MTNVFPALPGLQWSVTKSPAFATRIQKSVSGRELRLNDQPLPRWEFTLGYEVLRDSHDSRSGAGLGAGYNELRTLMGFFLGQQGSYQPFYFDDPTDDYVAGQTLAVGDGTTLSFQLLRTMGNFVEPIIAPNTVNAVYLNGVSQTPWTYSVNYNNGIITFATAPGAGVVVSADFSYYFLVRFSDDSAEFQNFMLQLWSAKQIKLMSLLDPLPGSSPGVLLPSGTIGLWYSDLYVTSPRPYVPNSANGSPVVSQNLFSAPRRLFASPVWGNTNCTITDDYATAPDGT